MWNVEIYSKYNFQTQIPNWYLEQFLSNYLQENATEPLSWYGNIDPGNGSLSSGNEPLTVPMLT